MSGVDLYIESVDDNLKPIVIKLRETITDISNDLEEGMKWNVPTYSINNNICSIMAHKNHVNLQIFQGSKLQDSEVLEGTGKEMRHLKYTKIGDVNIIEVKKIIKQAIVIDKKT